MNNFAYLTRKGYAHDQLLKLPYPVFCSYLVKNQIADLQETEAGREYLAKMERLNVTSPDLSSLRKLGGYKEVGGTE